MGPVTKHLSTIFPELPVAIELGGLHWIFSEKIKLLGPAFYSKVLPLHPLLNLEYSVLCNQLREDFLNLESANKAQVIQRLVSALVYCELLEHLHQNYLVVPREVARFRKQKAMFQSLLRNAGYSFPDPAPEATVIVGLSLAQQVRDVTIQANWYRILLNRSKRVVNLLNNVVTDNPVFNTFVVNLDKYMNPSLLYLGLLFHLPRLLTNLFLIIKHTIPGSWMSEEERSIAWTERLHAQIQRRWFELGNDLVWTTVAVLNGFVFIGALAPIALYLSVAAFGFDMANAALRAFIELRRLHTLRADYEILLAKEKDQTQKTAIQEHLTHIDKRIHFEQMRFSIHVTGTVLIFAAMALALPVLAVNPIVLLASAVFLLLLWGVSLALTRKLETYRPKDAIEVPTNVSKIGFFSVSKKATDILIKEKAQDLGSTQTPGAEEEAPLFTN
jgi:hypothetical protein